MKELKSFLFLIGASFVLFFGVSFMFPFSISESLEGSSYFELTEEEKDEKKEEVISIKDELDNPDVLGYIRLLGTNIDEVFVQGVDNDYYLNYNEKRERDVRGAIFLDYRVKLNDRKLLVYGHNSSTLEVPFKELEKYYNKSFFDNHQFIEIRTEKKILTYQIFSIFIEVQDWSYMNINFQTEEDWYKHITKLKQKSMYDTGIDIKEDDHILILQTCSHHKDYKKYNDKYLLVIGKKI